MYAHRDEANLFGGRTPEAVALRYMKLAIHLVKLAIEFAVQGEVEQEYEDGHAISWTLFFAVKAYLRYSRRITWLGEVELGITSPVCNLYTLTDLTTNTLCTQPIYSSSAQSQKKKKKTVSFGGVSTRC